MAPLYPGVISKYPPPLSPPLKDAHDDYCVSSLSMMTVMTGMIVMTLTALPSGTYDCYKLSPIKVKGAMQNLLEV